MTEIPNTFPQELLTPEQQPLYKEWKELFNVCNTPPPPGVNIGTVIMPTGDLMDRAGPTLQVWKDLVAHQDTPPFLVVSGKWSRSDVPPNMGASGPRVARAMRMFGDIPKELFPYIKAEDKSAHTGQQAEFCYKMMKNGEIEEPWLVVVSQYHLPRLTSTFVKRVLKEEGNPQTKIYTVPLDLPWTGNPPVERRGRVNEQERWQLALEEIKKIHAMREKGDVATKEEMLEYSKWLREQK